MKRHAKEFVYYGVIVFISVTLSLSIHRAIDTTSFQAPGSRFTGEDAIWLIEHSNIVLDRDARIDGIETPFRDYINSR